MRLLLRKEACSSPSSSPLLPLAGSSSYTVQFPPKGDSLIMEAITASLERSMQNCSLTGSGGDGGDNTADTAIGGHHTGGDMTVDLNSDVSLPYQWEQCLDLTTGEVYYINWRNGMKAKEDPRQATSFEQSDDYNSEEESPVESEDGDDDTSSSSRDDIGYRSEQEVLVVAGCKSCLMYSMLPKTTVECPKCTGFLLHFDRPENVVL